MCCFLRRHEVPLVLAVVVVGGGVWMEQWPRQCGSLHQRAQAQRVADFFGLSNDDGW